MADNTITLSLQGDIALKDFAIAIDSFAKLVNNLTRETTELAEVEWEISDLQPGSATVSVSGYSSNPETVAKVIAGYSELGLALSTGADIPYSNEVVKPTRSLLSVLNGQVTGISFITSQQEVFISQYEDQTTIQPLSQRQSWGAITGIVETVSQRGGLRFKVREPLYNRSVECFANEKQAEFLREAWRKKVKIYGLISREIGSGKPTKIQRVVSIDFVEDVPPGTYKQALGALPWNPGDEPAEVTIRRIRDDY